ncbi:MAG TPA: helix-hairpin-helix domain-containing protein [Bryobacteraceae bacterium]|jgi:DNA uptake protein ComE-like DNA-binding protein
MNMKRLLLIAAVAMALPFTSLADSKAPKPAAAKTAAVKQVDINSASAADLEALPTIGKAKSAKIIAGRPWKGKDDLVAKGILSAADYAKVKDLIIAKQK